MSAPRIHPVQVRLLLVTAMVSSAAGLVLELLLVTQASYLSGDATLATGVVVGTFLAAMGLGAWLSQFLAQRGPLIERLLKTLVWVELALAPLCLLGPLALYLLFWLDGSLWLGTTVFTVLVGVLAGMELPLITRLLESQQELRRALARVLALDYLGSLVGALLFPLVLLPLLGLLPTAGALSLIPVVSALLLTLHFPVLAPWRRWVLLLLPLLTLAAVWVAPLGDRIEDGLYQDPVIGRFQSRFQRVVLTRRADDLRLYLDGNLQFSSVDEYRYHEALVHPAMASVRRPERILLLGAGDGLALREILRWPSVRSVSLVELDPLILDIARRHPRLLALNQGCLTDPRVTVLTGDAFTYTRRLDDSFDVVIADFPDPDQAAVARLYSVGFYQSLRRLLAPGGVIVTQASTPFFSPNVLASIERSLQVTGLMTHPYSLSIPSFGPWGFVLAHQAVQLPPLQPLPFKARWADDQQLRSVFAFPMDYRPNNPEQILENRLSRPVLLHYQRSGVSK